MGEREDQNQGPGGAADLFGDAPRRVRVLLPLPLAGAYDYLLPAGLDGRRGAIVEVPLGKRLIDGVIWGEAAGDVVDDRLKAVVRQHPIDPLPETVLALVDWVAAYTLSPPGAVLRMAISVPAAFTPPPPVTL
ncbi:MAG: primosomal protein N', partial [Thalassobaculaceae bacterium]